MATRYVPAGFGELTAHFSLAPAGIVLILWAPLAAGQNAVDPALANAPVRIVAAEGRELVVLPPYRPVPDAPRPAQPGDGGLTVQSHETASRRMLVVSHGGETYRASAPLDGPGSLLAFDPARRAFAELSPSIRVELGEGLDIDSAAAAVGATRVDVFASLGFAILTLPRGLHPADAVTLVRNLPGQPGAALRLRAPRIRWR